MKVNVTETVLRDANQSLIATRMRFVDFEGILEKMDQAGYYSVECWGGATFDSCLRYLSEDPWDRLRKIKGKIRKTKLQMLLRGQNLLGYKHYPDDVVKKFVEYSIKNGIDIIRIFDALNDFRNIEVAVKETLKHGGLAQGAICYTLSPIHNLESYVKMGKQLESMGVNSICIKDMAGIMSPQEASDLFKALSEAVKLPLVLHTHSTTGLGPITCVKAVEAGCSSIDTAISVFSGGTSQPATETLSYTLKQMGYDTGLNEKILKEINDFFRPVKDKFLQSGELDSYVMGTETDALNYQIPGGMLSNLIAQLKLKAYLKGEYGKAPGEVDSGLIKKVLGDEKVITNRFADNLEPGFEKAKKEIGNMAGSDEDVLSYVAFPQIAEKFFKEREEKKASTVSYSIVKA